MKIYVTIAALLFIGMLSAQKNTFSVTNGYKCTETVNYKNEVKITVQGNYRVITSNAIPLHTVGQFPNSGNPNTISPQQKKYTVPLQPKKASKLTSVYSKGILGIGTPAYEFGVAINGVKMEPTAMEFFVNFKTREMNLDWSKEALSTNTNLGDDCNNAHVQPTGEYHYHGTPWGIVNKIEGKQMFLIGWAADGFPIYYKYAYKNANDLTSEVVEMKSSYRLRSGKRPGDGVTAPSGNYDGTYARDFEYIKGFGDLDEANARYGKTPEFPNGSYYYIITDDFPSLPRFFIGTPHESFKTNIGMGNHNQRGFPPRNKNRGPNKGGERPNPDELFKKMDANNDGKLSKKEIRGLLLEHFDEVDKNNDGYITKEELENAPRPQHGRRRRH